MYQLVIWTRPADCWEEDCQLLAANQLLERTLHVPCIVAEPLAFKVPDVSPPFVIITSARTVHYLAQRADARHWLIQQKNIIAFGFKTFQALQSLPISSEQIYHYPQASHGRELAHHIVNDPQVTARLKAEFTPESTGLHLATERPAFDFSYFLTSHGLPTKHLAIYKTSEQPASIQYQEHLKGKNSPLSRNTKLTSDGLKALISAHPSSAVAFASPSAVRGFLNWFSQSELASDQATLAQLHAICIGTTTSTAAASVFPHIRSCSAASVNDVSINGLIRLLQTPCASKFNKDISKA